MWKNVNSFCSTFRICFKYSDTETYQLPKFEQVHFTTYWWVLKLLDEWQAVHIQGKYKCSTCKVDLCGEKKWRKL